MPVAKTKSGKKSETPLMKQYYRIKQDNPDAILLFRVGDFYETFGEDAIATSKVLGIVLTQRKNGAASSVELAGFPHHALDSYLPKLVRAGYRVAICDQLEDPKASKTVVKRGVTELVTPGVSYNEQVLEHRSNNFLCAVHFGKKRVGVAFVDVSTGEFLVAEGGPDYADKLVQGFGPSEVLYQRNHEDSLESAIGKGFHTYRLEDWVFSSDFAREKLTGHFGTTSLKGFGVEDLEEAIVAAGAIIHYLNDTHHDKLEHIGRIQRIDEGQHVWLDRFTVRNLELINAQQYDGRSLMQVMDMTVSPMGARLLRRWLVLPLKSPDQIKERHEVVDYFMNNEDSALAIREAIDKMGDLERLISRVSVGKANPREVLQLGKSARSFAPIRKFCEEADNAVLNRMAEQINLCQPMLERIEKEIQEEAPAQVSKGGVICDGVDPDLDEAREMAHSGKDYLIGLQKREGEATGIPSLKVAYNNVFGYYLEVRNTYKDKVPQEWVRKQTLVNAERYITQELKEYESKILGAEEKILQLEEKLFRRLVEFLAEYIEPVQYTALVLARLDCLLSFAQSASQNGYTRPTIDESDVIDIQDGRHPVIESELPLGEAYIPNDVYLDNQTQQVLMITGPNMSGKSALLRQTALIALMAQMGSFVPAKRARIGIVDKVFSRVGASDNISSGESTFMVEMNETASILNNLTPRSLVLLDEIGRGTSTYDGISIAWAITEYIHENQRARAKTLFATHYHELNAMADQFERIKNFSVSVKEYENKVIFLRKLVQGGSEHSFGIHVAKMAGMPSLVIRRAGQILEHLEQTHAPREQGEENKIAPAGKDVQLSFFQLDDPVLEQIRDEIANLDINSLTPVEALMKLNEIKKISTGSD